MTDDRSRGFGLLLLKKKLNPKHSTGSTGARLTPEY
jgi:hypothetical protein